MKPRNSLLSILKFKDEREQQDQAIKKTAGKTYSRMFGRWSNWDEAFEHNRNRYYTILDKLGIDQDAVLLGFEYGKPKTIDNLVYHEQEAWNVYSIMGVGGAGKDVLTGIIFEPENLYKKKPVLLHDRTREYASHAHANQNTVSLNMLRLLGFEAIGLKNFETVTPSSLVQESQHKFEVTWKDFYDLSSPYGWILFNQFLTLDAKDVSPGTQRECYELFSYTPESFDEVYKHISAIHAKLVEEKRSAIASKSLEPNIHLLEDERAVTNSTKYDLGKSLAEGKVIDFITALGAEDYIINMYETFVNALIYDLSNKGKIPNILEVFSEVTTVYKQGMAPTPLSQILDRKVLRERKQGNDFIFSSQKVTEFPESLLMHSNCLLTVKPQTQQQYAIIFGKQATEATQKKLSEMPQLPAKSFSTIDRFPAWIKLAYKDDPQVFTPLTTVSQFHEVKKRVLTG